MSRKSKGKRLLYISEDIIKEILEISRRRGQSISNFAEETLKLAVRTNHLGYTPEKTADLLEIMQTMKIFGGAFVPQNVLNYLTSMACEAGKEQLQAIWYESGRLHGRYLKEKFEDPVKAFKNFLEVARWNLNEVQVEMNGDTVKVRCISTVMTAEETEMLSKFIEGAMHSMEYETEKSDCLKGMIFIEFKRTRHN